MKKKLPGAEILLECLLEQNADVIFGYPGGQVLPIYDALYKYRDKIKHYLVSHEQGAAHMADGFARSTGRVGVCIATSGPGATNLVTGIATAYMDSVPMVAITGNVPLPSLGKDSFQEVDITGITMPVTKHNYIVKNTEDLADIVRQAFYIAREGRPGPVLIDIPRDVTTQFCDYEYKQPKKPVRKTDRLNDSMLSTAAEYVTGAKKPFLYCGGGVIAAEASEELMAFVNKIDAPLCVSAMGIGGFPATDSRCTGLIGMHGSGASNTLVSECDLLVAVGARFSDRVLNNLNRFAKQAKILHMDVDPAEIGKNIEVHHSVLGDLKSTLAELTKIFPQQSHSEWINHSVELKKRFPLKYENTGGELHPQDVVCGVAVMFAKHRGDILITTEVGQHQMWACQYMPIEKPRTFMTSGGLGTMGFGLGAAIGAAAGNPGKSVINIAGDGCFRMNCIELATAVEYGLPIIEVVVNNHVLGMVRQWQTLFFNGNYSHTNLHGKKTDFIKLAEAFGAAAYNVTDKKQLYAALQEAYALKKPAVINCEVGMDDKVLPMVPLGKGVDQFITEC
ncbi:MAG: biosynthetic-type acetolactate synthase large subunit [Defluviitaleaceae bacterium]|nr:biosynthetic-type acetolactate synthase large subunit [Defluviitaleaceae bacterium]